MTRDRRSHRRRLVEVVGLESRRLMAADGGPTVEWVAHVTPVPAEILAAATTTPVTAAAGVPLTSVPALSSNPGARAKLYLDFNGALATTWGGYSVTATPAYDQDGDVLSFSSGELGNIRDIWARVAEKYSPFNIDVTTVDPVNYADKVAQRVVIGGTGGWLGGGGGISYVGAFYNTAPNTSWVFSANLAGGGAKYVAEAAAHEAGHAFGLDHQSAYSGTTRTSDYYAGDGARAPIMGNSYNAARGLWWYGTSTTSTTYQDDLSIVAGASNGFGYRADDHGNSISAATALTLSGTSVSGSGVITTTGDSDYFSFTSGAGQITLAANPVTGGMLDAKLAVYSSTGALLASRDGGLGESLSLGVAAGSYRLAVSSHGGYGDVGQYTISGTVVPATTTTTPPAAPVNLSATAASTSQINLAWSDVGTETGYKVERSSDNGATWGQIGTTSASVTTFASTGLAAGARYTYRVRATNAGGDSGYSNAAAATTQSSTPTGSVRLTGTTFGTPGSYNNSGSTYQKAVDGNLSTYFDAPTPHGNHVGLDLGATAAARVTSVRFSPRAGFTGRMVGGKFQGSNTTSTSGFVDLATVTAAPVAGAYTTLTVANPTSFRYLRYVAPDGSYGNVAEVEFYGVVTGSTTPPPSGGSQTLTGTAFGTPGSYGNLGNTFAKAFDNSLASFFDAPAGNGNYVGLDLGTAKVITAVRYAPRSGFTGRMVGGKFQGSNSSSSSGFVDLFTITTAPASGTYTTASVTNATAFRYVRYLAPDGSYGNVAEIEFQGRTPSATVAAAPVLATKPSPAATAKPARAAAGLDLFSDVPVTGASPADDWRALPA